jgi:hypothetical protein
MIIKASKAILQVKAKVKRKRVRRKKISVRVRRKRVKRKRARIKPSHKPVALSAIP